MFRTPLFILFFLLFFGQGVSRAAMPLDSIGVEQRNGKNYVIHKVVPKETLFALSRKYQVPVDKIVDANPKIQSGLQIGQLVYIPRNTVVAATAPATNDPAPAASRTFVVDDQGNKIHQVAEKQTLFSISRLYNVSVADIKKWNELSSDQVNIGDQLIVGIGNKPTANPQYSQEPDEDVEKAKTVSSQPVVAVPAKTEVPVSKPEPVVAAKTSDNTASEPVSKITETGLAEVIENRNENNKYLALHRTAPVGTILQVKNLMNNQSVYVRVIGTLPNTGANDKVIIKISNRAYQKLAALDSRFRVEVSYMP